MQPESFLYPFSSLLLWPVCMSVEHHMCMRWSGNGGWYNRRRASGQKKRNVRVGLCCLPPGPWEHKEKNMAIKCSWTMNTHTDSSLKDKRSVLHGQNKNLHSSQRYAQGRGNVEGRLVRHTSLTFLYREEMEMEDRRWIKYCRTLGFIHHGCRFLSLNLQML